MQRVTLAQPRGVLSSVAALKPDFRGHVVKGEQLPLSEGLPGFSGKQTLPKSMGRGKYCGQEARSLLPVAASGGGSLGGMMAASTRRLSCRRVFQSFGGGCINADSGGTANTTYLLSPWL